MIGSIRFNKQCYSKIIANSLEIGEKKNTPSCYKNIYTHIPNTVNVLHCKCIRNTYIEIYRMYTHNRGKKHRLTKTVFKSLPKVIYGYSIQAYLFLNDCFPLISKIIS
jgi:hypothetical protein